jgi:hypothetical protein
MNGESYTTNLSMLQAQSLKMPPYCLLRSTGMTKFFRRDYIWG